LKADPPVSLREPSPLLRRGDFAGNPPYAIGGKLNEVKQGGALPYLAGGCFAMTGEWR